MLVTDWFPYVLSKLDEQREGLISLLNEYCNTGSDTVEEETERLNLINSQVDEYQFLVDDFFKQISSIDSLELRITEIVQDSVELKLDLLYNDKPLFSRSEEAFRFMFLFKSYGSGEFSKYTRTIDSKKCVENLYGYLIRHDPIESRHGSDLVNRILSAFFGKKGFISLNDCHRYYKSSKDFLIGLNRDEMYLYAKTQVFPRKTKYDKIHPRGRKNKMIECVRYFSKGIIPVKINKYDRTKAIR